VILDVVAAAVALGATIRMFSLAVRRG